MLSQSHGKNLSTAYGDVDIVVNEQLTDGQTAYP